MINYKSIPTYLFIFLLTFCFKGYGQGNTGIILKGKLKNENNEPVEGATLLLKDTENGQVVKQGLSEADGTFSFAVSAGSYVLAVSYLGALVYQNDQLQLSASVDLGELKIKTANLNLKEIVIQSSRN